MKSLNATLKGDERKREPWFGAWPPRPWFTYKPDAYLERVGRVIKDLTFLGAFDEKAFKKKDPPFDTPQDITEQVVMLREFSELTLELWEALGKAGLLPTMNKYANAMRRLEQHYAKTDCKKCGCHAPAHVAGCENMPKEWR